MTITASPHMERRMTDTITPETKEKYEAALAGKQMQHMDHCDWRDCSQLFALQALGYGRVDSIRIKPEAPETRVEWRCWRYGYWAGAIGGRQSAVASTTNGKVLRLEFDAETGELVLDGCRVEEVGK